MRCHAFVIGLFSVTLTTSASAQQPLDEFLAAYPFGEHRCIAVTPDGSRGFVAEGAGIAVLDFNGMTAVTELQAIERVEVPHAAPEALAYFRHPDADPQTNVRRRWLFIAGGSLGLSALELCESSFAQPPVACGNSGYDWQLVDRPGSGTSFQWKRCVDVALVEHPQAGPLVVGLFAASSDPNKSSVGASEIAAFRVLADGTISFYARLEFANLDPAPVYEYLATGMAPDPADPNTIFVSLSKAWLWKVTILHAPTPSMTVAHIAASGINTCQLPPSSCTTGEAMTDVDAVVAGSAGTVVYAALDYGRVLEYRLATGVIKERLLWVGTAPVYTLVTFPRRIEAHAESGTEVLVTVACHSTAWIDAESSAPYTSTGKWGNICLAPYVPDPNQFPQGQGLSEAVRILWADPNSNYAPTPVGGVDAIPYSRTWGQIALRRLGAWNYLLHAASSVSATSVFEIGFEPLDGVAGAFGPLLPVLDFELLATYAGHAITPSDGVVSGVNPDLILFGGEAIGRIHTSALARIVGPVVDIVPILQTDSACPGSGHFDGGVCEQPGQSQGAKHDTPNPFLASVYGSAVWPDPNDPAREWFLPGGENRVLVDALCGNEIDICTFGSPCATLPTQPWFWRKGELFPSITDVGWYPANFNVLASPLSGITMDVKWGQFPSPTGMATTRSEDIPYTSSTADPRLADPDPENPGEIPFTLQLHAVRGGTDYGYEIFETRDLMQRARTSCPSLPPGAARGFGERIVTSANDQVRFVEALTHPELELPAVPENQCIVRVGCAPATPTFSRHQQSNKVHVFPVVKPAGTPGAGETAWISAVAGGFVTTGSGGSQPPGCLWLTHHLRALVSVYCLDDLKFDPPRGPQLIRVLLGPQQPVESSAIAVRTASLGEGSAERVYAFVADFTGNLLVYDVSGDQLFLPAPPALGTPYLPNHTPLEPIAIVPFPSDPRDGLQPNCVDVEIEGAYAYCALARGGIGIVDIADPLNPFLHEVIDTPGLVQGLTLRMSGTGDPQLVVGDSRAGFRLYGVSGSGASTDSSGSQDSNGDSQ